MNRRIYFAGSIRGGREDAGLYKRIIDYINKTDIVVTEHIGKADMSMKSQTLMSDACIYERDTKWLESCDLLIAECTCPSLGVGYELAYAEAHGIPAYVFYNGLRSNISAMLNGNPYFTVVPYENEEELYQILDDILNLNVDCASLITVDSENKQIVEKLKRDGISCIEKGEYTLMNIILANSKEAIDKVHLLSLRQNDRRKLVLLQTSNIFEVDEKEMFDAILSFPNGSNTYEEIKSFLYCIRNLLEIHWIISVDFHDFYSVIKGKNIISMQRFTYRKDIEEALYKLNYNRDNKQKKYIFAISGVRNQEEGLRQIQAFDKYLSEKIFIKESDFCYNIIPYGMKQVFLLTATSY